MKVITNRGDAMNWDNGLILITLTIIVKFYSHEHLSMYQQEVQTPWQRNQPSSLAEISVIFYIKELYIIYSKMMDIHLSDLNQICLLILCVSSKIHVNFKHQVET